MVRYGLPRKYMLKSRKEIEQLFQEGFTIKAYPVMARCIVHPEQEVSFRCGFSVSKKNFRRAVDRNRIKRLMREGVRINQDILRESEILQGSTITFMLIYVGKESPDFHSVEKKIIAVLERLGKGANSAKT